MMKTKYERPDMIPLKVEVSGSILASSGEISAYPIDPVDAVVTPFGDPVIGNLNIGDSEFF